MILFYKESKSKKEKNVLFFFLCVFLVKGGWGWVGGRWTDS